MYILVIVIFQNSCIKWNLSSNPHMQSRSFKFTILLPNGACWIQQEWLFSTLARKQWMAQDCGVLRKIKCLRLFYKKTETILIEWRFSPLQLLLNDQLRGCWMIT